MGRGRRARRSGPGGGGGGGGSRSGRSSAGHGLSRTQQQEQLVGNFPRPTAAYVLPKSHGRSGSGSGSHDDYQYDECQYRLNQIYDAVRLCGSDCSSVMLYMPFLENVCGIRVLPDRLENKATDEASAAAANRRTKK